MSAVPDDRSGADVVGSEPELEPLSAFVEALHGLRTRAGNPTLDRLVDLTGQQGHPVPRSTLHQKLRGQTPPDWSFVEAFVRACFAHARQQRRQLRATDADLEWWRDEHSRLMKALAAARPGQRHAKAADQQAVDLFVAERHAYERRLAERYGRLDLEILTPKEQDEHRQVLLRSVFVPQHVRAELPAAELPKELIRRLMEAGDLPTEDVPEGVSRERLARAKETSRQPTRPVLQLLASPGQRLVVLLGDPGAGKSTLARYVVLTLAGRKHDEALAPLVGWLPLLVELRSYAEPRWHESTFLDYLDHLHAAEGLGLPKQALDAHLHADGRAVVIFDGLDELFDPALREAVTRQIAAFAARYPKTRIVVTSRVLGYRNAVLAGAQFTHYTLQDLDQAGIEQFVSNWYELACPDDPIEAARRCRRLIAAAAGSPSIRELAGNPLLLTILSIIGRRQELPRDRRSVYQHAAAVLVEHWDVERHLRDSRIDMSYIDREDKLELLQRIARRMQSSRSGLAGNHIAGADLLAEFDKYLQERYQLTPVQTKPAARAMLDQFRERNFILSHFGADVYGFVHRAFLEYFSAADIVHRFRDKREWTPEDLVRDVFGRRWSDPAWQEVLLLVAGMIDETFTATAIDHLLQANKLWFLSPDPPRNVLLALRCLGEVRKLGLLAQQGANVTDAVISVLETTIVQAQDDYSSAMATADSIRQIAIPVFEAVGVRWPGRKRYWDWYRTMAWRRTRYFWRTNLWPIAEVAALVAAVTNADDAHVKGALRSQVLFGVSEIRKAAVDALAAGWGKDPGVRRLLQRQAAADPEWDVRRAAVEALVAGWADDPDTLPLVRERAMADPDEDVQQAAMQALAGRWPDDSGTVSLIKDMTAHLNKDVRVAAVETLAEQWPGDGQIGQWLLHLAGADVHQDVRRAAVRAVADGWQEDAGTGPWLQERATTDAHQDVRAAAVEALAQAWRDNQATVPWLRGRAMTDPDPHVQAVATLTVAEMRRDDPDTGRWLRDQATSRYSSVRKAAVEALVAGWADDPDTLTLVRERAMADPDEDVQQAAMQAIAEWWPDDPGTVSLVRDMTAHASKDVRVAAVETLADRWREDLETGQWLRRLAGADVHQDVRQAAVRAVAAGWQNDGNTGRWLRERAVKDLHEDVRKVALQAAAARSEDRDTGRWLQERAMADPDPGVQQVAIIAISAGWRDDRDTGLWLQQRASVDLHPNVRQAAIQALCVGWPLDPGTPRLLRDCIATDPDETVRAAAANGLCLGWPEDANTLSLLRERATADPDEFVRIVALEGLCLSRPDDPDIARFLRERATADVHEDVRWTALQGLCVGWHDDPGTLHALRERAVRDLDEDVRKAALEALVAAWPNDPGTLPLLREQAVKDLHQEVRIAALRALAGAWRDDPGTLPLLRERATIDPDRDVRNSSVAILYLETREAALLLAAVKEVAVTAPDESTRQGAVEFAAAMGRENRDIGQWLGERAAADPHPDVRNAAVAALCSGWRDDPDTLSVLRDVATTDSQEDVCRAASQALAVFEMDEARA